MNYKVLMSAIKLMYQAMTAIFLVMAVISIIVYLFIRLLRE